MNESCWNVAHESGPNQFHKLPDWDCQEFPKKGSSCRTGLLRRVPELTIAAIIFSITIQHIGGMPESKVGLSGCRAK
jgi:hypothetical protein